ncbi:MAG: InlB B-repeat-containing protein [Acetatifactor sp.]|nr:InlB B-repeat-containing protein [Acetatifactor sp.]
MDGGESCLSPKTFTPEKPGWEFLGWTQDDTVGEDITDKIINELYMEGDELTLYAVFKQDIILTTVSGGVNTSNRKQAYYNNGNILYPTFTVANPMTSGLTFNGWSTSVSSTSIAYKTISNILFSKSTTLYAVRTYNNAEIPKTSWKNPNNGESYFVSGYKGNSASDSLIVSNGQPMYIDTSGKYSSFTVTGKASAIGEVGNNTIGQTVAYLRLNKITVRAYKRTIGADQPYSEVVEVSGYPGSSDAIFNITTAAVNNGIYVNVYADTWNPSLSTGQVTISKIVGVGKTVIG